MIVNRQIHFLFSILFFKPQFHRLTELDSSVFRMNPQLFWPDAALEFPLSSLEWLSYLPLGSSPIYRPVVSKQKERRREVLILFQAKKLDYSIRARQRQKERRREVLALYQSKNLLRLAGPGKSIISTRTINMWNRPRAPSGKFLKSLHQVCCD